MGGDTSCPGVVGRTYFGEKTAGYQALKCLIEHQTRFNHAELQVDGEQFVGDRMEVSWMYASYVPAWRFADCEVYRRQTVLVL